MKKNLRLDTSDIASIERLISEFEEYPTMLEGEDEDGCKTSVWVYHDRVEVRTMQRNGWMRINIYWRDDWTCEELYTK